jgi:hypothetical protein
MCRVTTWLFFREIARIQVGQDISGYMIRRDFEQATVKNPHRSIGA